MKNRLTALFLAFALIFALLPAAVLTASAETYSGTCGDNLTWTLDTKTGVLEISGTGAMKQWIFDDAPWDSYRSSIKSVNIGNGVTSIGCDAFTSCKSLTNVTIPDSVTYIGLNAFDGCWKLTSVNIPDSVTSIGSSAFFDTGYYMNDSNWTDGVLYIGNYLIEAKMTLEGAYTVKEGTKLIADSAFSKCTGLMSFTIPDSVTSIGQNAFNNTGYYNEASNWTDDVLYVGNYLIISNTTLEGAYTVKEGTKLIADTAFFCRTRLTSVTIPDGVTSIGNAAFSDCSSLTSVTIPDSVTSIGWEAFHDCSSLTSVTIPASVTSIGSHAFGYEYDIETAEEVFVGDITIYGYKDSEAQTYAEENGLAFIALDATPACQHEHTHSDHKDATCTEAGYDKTVCDDCGEVLSETVLPALGHAFVNGVCTRCGAEDPDYDPDAPTEPEVPGDLNGDGDVDAVDSIRLARFLVGLVELTEEQQAAADVNGDGDVTATDAIRLARYLVGLVETLRPEPAKAARSVS